MLLKKLQCKPVLRRTAFNFASPLKNVLTSRSANATEKLAAGNSKQPASTTTPSAPVVKMTHKGFLRDEFELGTLLGSGKYGEVYRCRPIDNPKIHQDLAVKILKPGVKSELINKEISIIQSLQGGPNMMVLLRVMMDRETMMPAIVFEFFDSLVFKDSYRQFTEDDVKLYIYEMLRALEFVHQCGIMHRDIKASNVLFHKDKTRVRLIDWGLADTLSATQDYSVRVSTKCYKAPELLVNNERKNYTQAVDLWGVGCIMATCLFHSMPFFRAKENEELLNKQIECLGSDMFKKWMKDSKQGGVLNVINKPQLYGDTRKMPWTSLIKDTNAHLISTTALNLLDGLLCFDPKERLTAREALRHPYFLKKEKPLERKLKKLSTSPTSSKRM